jgi:hypothetical protein
MMMVVHVHRQVLHVAQYSTTHEKYVNDFGAGLIKNKVHDGHGSGQHRQLKR